LTRTSDPVQTSMSPLNVSLFWNDTESNSLLRVSPYVQPAPETNQFESVG
jgi:phospholipase C